MSILDTLRAKSVVRTTSRRYYGDEGYDEVEQVLLVPTMTAHAGSSK